MTRQIGVLHSCLVCEATCDSQRGLCDEAILAAITLPIEESTCCVRFFVVPAPPYTFKTAYPSMLVCARFTLDHILPPFFRSWVICIQNWVLVKTETRRFSTTMAFPMDHNTSHKRSDSHHRKKCKKRYPALSRKGPSCRSQFGCCKSLNFARWTGVPSGTHTTIGFV